MQTNLDAMFKNNTDFEKEGIWFKTSETTKFRIRRFGGKNDIKIKQATAKFYKPYARAIEQNTLDAETTLDVTVKTFVHACLVDWKGVEIDGEEKPYSPELAIELFKNLPELFNILFEYAGDSKNFREDLGNF